MASPSIHHFSLTQRLNVVKAKSNPHSSALLNKVVRDMGKPQTTHQHKEGVVVRSYP